MGTWEAGTPASASSQSWYKDRYAAGSKQPRSYYDGEGASKSLHCNQIASATGSAHSSSGVIGKGGRHGGRGGRDPSRQGSSVGRPLAIAQTGEGIDKLTVAGDVEVVDWESAFNDLLSLGPREKL